MTTTQPRNAYGSGHGSFGGSGGGDGGGNGDSDGSGDGNGVGISNCYLGKASNSKSEEVEQ